MNRTNTDNSTIILKVACAIVFCLFTYCYLYFYQVDVMYVEQHILSGGKTSYDRTIGALLITAVLYLLQVGVLSLTKLYGRFHALTYLPSFFILIIITNCVQPEDKVLLFGTGALVTSVLGFATYTVVVISLRRWQPYNNLYNRSLGMYWTNIITMVVMAFITGILANGNDVFYYRMKVEMCLVRGEFNKALAVGVKSVDTDSSLTMLRIYALARDGKLGEHLFEYPLVGMSTSLIPNGMSVRSLVYPEKAIRTYTKQKGRRDYNLCKQLLDCNLDNFVRIISNVYGSDTNTYKSFPKHYREALILYTHVRSNPIIVYHEDIMDADYEDFQQLIKTCKETNESLSKVKDVYGNTYWHYYYLNSNQ